MPSGFFGRSVEESFKYFSFAHFLPLIVGGTVIFLICRYKDKLRNFKHEKALRFWFAFAMLVAEMSYFWRLLYTGGNVEDHLPITVCGWACIAGAFMLMSENKTLSDITYFWAFGGSTNALLTPTVIMYTGPAYYRYYQFWFEHLAIFIAVMYMIMVKGYRPTLKSFAIAYSALFAWGMFAVIVNSLIGGRANYLFLANVKEDGGSALDFLPESVALKCLIMGFAAFVLFALSYLPWFIKDLRKKKIGATKPDAPIEAGEPPAQ